MANSKYGRIIAIATSVCVILLGIAFIVSAAHLYFTGGDNPYSRERVGEYLSWLIIPSIITLLPVIGGVIYNVVTGKNDTKNVQRTNRELLESFEARYNLADFAEETNKAVKIIRKKQNIVDFVASQITAFMLVFVIDYMIFIAEFSVENLNANVMAAFAIVLPLSAIAIAIHIPRAYISEESAKKQLELMKESIKAHGAPKAKKAEETDKKSENGTVIARYAILGVALLLVVLGIFNGSMNDVLQKAVKICTECIGLG